MACPVCNHSQEGCAYCNFGQDGQQEGIPCPNCFGWDKVEECTPCDGYGRISTNESRPGGAANWWLHC
jgi:hypothetical protein